MIGLITAAVLMIPLIVCLICNLAVGHALNWFFIVLTSLMVFASITVVPLLVNDKKILWTICSFTISLVALLGTICIYSGGKWFYLAVIPCVAGLVICFAPFLIRYISLPKGVCNHKALITMSVESLAVYSIIAVVGIYSKYPGYWAAAIPITTYCLLVPWGIVLVLRYLPVSKMFRASIACLVSSLLLTFVNDVVDWSIGDFNGICLAKADFSNWNTYTNDGNVGWCILVIGVILTLIFAILGCVRLSKREIK